MKRAHQEVDHSSPLARHADSPADFLTDNDQRMDLWESNIRSPSESGGAEVNKGEMERQVEFCLLGELLITNELPS